MTVDSHLDELQRRHQALGPEQAQVQVAPPDRCEQVDAVSPLGLQGVQAQMDEAVGCQDDEDPPRAAGEERDAAAEQATQDKIDNFLKKFVEVGTSNTIGAIDMKKVLKTLPYQFDKNNVNKIDMIDFTLIQISLIAFQNDD